MATTNESDSALSGGLLVILGIIVALVLGVFFFQYKGGDSTPDISVSVPSASDAVDNAKDAVRD